MTEFLQSNLSQILGMTGLTLATFIILRITAKSDINSFDKKRVKKGMKAMTDDEKQLSIQSMRFAIRNTVLAIYGAYIVSLLMNYFF